MKTIRIMIIEDHSVVVDGVRSILSKELDIAIVAVAATAEEGLGMLSSESVDLVIVDITLKGTMNGIELTKALRERFPAIRVLVMSMHDDLVYGERSMKSGAAGYLMKEVASSGLVVAIRAIMDGGRYMSDRLTKRMMGTLLEQGDGDAVAFSVNQLSDREFEVFQLFGNGYSPREIAERLRVSVNTVESHRNRIKTKLNLESSAALSRHAIQWIINHRQPGD